MQISAKVALSITLVIAVAGVLAGAIALNRQEAEQREQFAVTNRDALKLLALAVAPAVAEGRHDRVQAAVDNIANFEDRFRGVEELSVLGRDQRVIASLDPTRFNDEVSDATVAGDLERTAASYDFQGEHLQLVIPLRLKQHLGVMRATLSQKHLVERTDRQRANALALLVATMLMVALTLHLLHRRLVARRLSDLAVAAGALGEGRMDVRAEAEGKDEIAELGRSFNGMAAAIAHYTEDLESIIAERTEELEAANRRLEQLATTDQLTQVWNRRYFDDAARRAIEVAQRNERPLCVALVDTDRFKTINDTWGHPVGDCVLVAVADVLKTSARKADLVARIGGEEFAILMPEVGVGLAAQAAERMRVALQDEVRPRVEAIGDRVVTASFGVAGLERASDRLEDLLSAADEALYAAKQSGRNRVCVADRDAEDAPPQQPTRAARRTASAVQIGRRQLLTLAGAWLCGCAGDEVARGTQVADPLEALLPTGSLPERLRVGIPPSSGAATHERLEPLFRYLSETLGRPVQGVTASRYDQLAVQLQRQEIDIGAFSPAAYAQSKDTMNAVAIATGTRNGSPTYLGYLVVRKQPQRPTLAELSGKRIAWVERSSTSGYLYPRAMLSAKGHAPDSFFAEQRFAGNHQAALTLLLDGEVEVAAAASPFVDRETPTAIEGAEQLMVVAKTARIPRDCLVVHRRLQRQLAFDVRAALLRLTEHQEVSTALEASWGLDGFVLPMHRLYDQVAELVSAG